MIDYGFKIEIGSPTLEFFHSLAKLEDELLVNQKRRRSYFGRNNKKREEMKICFSKDEVLTEINKSIKKLKICGKCGYSTSIQCNLDKHLKVHNKNPKFRGKFPAENSVEAENAEEIGPTSEIRCKFCYKIFKEKIFKK